VSAIVEGFIFSRYHTVGLLSSIFILVFSSIKFDIGFIDKNYLLTILESMPIKIFSNSKNSNFPCGRTLCIVTWENRNEVQRCPPN
jgi:hypothetical protein